MDISQFIDFVDRDGNPLPKTIEEIRGLGQVRTPESIRVLIELLKLLNYKSRELVLAAIEALVELAPDSIQPLLDTFDMSNEDISTEIYIVQTLALISEPQTLDLLLDIASLNTSDLHWMKGIRVAARSLGKIGVKVEEEATRCHIIEKLGTVLQTSSDWALRYAAIVSLEEMAMAQCIPVLEQSLAIETDILVKKRLGLALAKAGVAA